MDEGFDRDLDLTVALVGHIGGQRAPALNQLGNRATLPRLDPRNGQISALARMVPDRE